MVSTEEVQNTVCIGLVVAVFLLNSGRVSQSIKFCKECLKVLNSQVLIKVATSILRTLYSTLTKAYDAMNDKTSKEKWLRKLHLLCEDCDGSVKRGRLILELAEKLHTQNKLFEARAFYELAVKIMETNSDANGEAQCYRNLGAREYQEKALAMQIEIGNKQGVAASYGNLGTLLQSLGKYDKAREYQEKALAIRIEIGNKEGEAASYGNVATLFESLGKYDKAQDYQEKALAIQIEIGDKRGEAASYEILGGIFSALGEFDEAERYLGTALRIFSRINARKGKASVYEQLTALFLSRGKYRRAEDYLDKARAIRMESEDRPGEASGYSYLGAISLRCGLYDKAEEYFKKSLTIFTEMGDKTGEAISYGHIAACFRSLDKYDVAEDYYQKALSLSRNIGLNLEEFQFLCELTVLKLLQCDRKETFSYLYQCIEKFDTLRGFLKDSDRFKISLLERYGTFPYKLLSHLLSATGMPQDALYVEELMRARGLADLMAARYSAKKQISGNPHSWCDIQNIITKESDCICVYTSVGKEDVRFWIQKAMGVVLFAEKKVSLAKNEVTGLVPGLDEFFRESFCNPANDISEENLLLFYKITIAPVAHLLKEPEIIIVPDSCMYQVPFGALTDQKGKFLSSTFRIRIIPSLTTLKLIQDSPPDYHNQSGVLVVGDPKVGVVMYKDRRKEIRPLPCARKEAEMIGKLFGVIPLIGDHAKKHTVLQKINSAGLIHFAAHGFSERGEIVLSPVCTTSRVPPREEAYLLTMEEISKTQLHAKLVVLSCCHSARGQIKTEGVIGIARAFLGSGARSVLAARWALDDEATEQFMTCFYEHLFRGESASESLHEARRWMRNNGFDEVKQWAPFILIGDNVTIDFRNWPVSSTP
ncbi:Tetratricopeptide repeat protein 28 [Stylophora pistillata]|uniref:Tetratricopeptide repeat protein 28 n=1 Tax=Stylophora pistillata TaxID=50429 RepID=A0A2B4SGM4_STYPI|nr:Tetratricopeptide repeat protein 28 [Stylophora pistillata]